MTPKLEEIGFYTLSDLRASKSCTISPLYRCELILTDRCNFQCPYCRGIEDQYKGDMPWYEAAYTIAQWQNHGLKNIRFSGGEPTLYRGLMELVSLSAKTCEHIAISTNGTASKDLYNELLRRGVNDFSISLDACCSSTCDKMSGRQGKLEKIISNIELLARRTYVTVGIVLTPDNEEEVDYTVTAAKSLGVSDIRIIPAAQWKPDMSIKLELNYSGATITREDRTEMSLECRMWWEKNMPKLWEKHLKHSYQHRDYTAKEYTDGFAKCSDHLNFARFLLADKEWGWLECEEADFHEELCSTDLNLECPIEGGCNNNGKLPTKARKLLEEMIKVCNQ